MKPRGVGHGVQGGVRVIAEGCAYQDECLFRVASTTGGVPS